jgi:hypothetical protein
VSASKCYFDSNPQNGGQAALVIDGAATISVSNCAFRPHAAFFSFRDRCKKTALDLQNCSGFVEMGPAFRFSKDASAQVSVRKSVFSRPEGRLEGSSPGLIYLAGENSLQYEGRQNLYHNLNTLLQKDKLIITNLNEFQDYLLKENIGSDVNSKELVASASPLQHLTPLTSSEPLLAFQLQPQYHNKKLGLQSSWAGDMPAPPIPLAKASPKKIVDADDGGNTPGVFSTVAEALVGAKDGDIIYIKHGENRKLVVPPITLRAGISVTIKPHKGGYRPILVLDKDFEKKESALFDVQKSKLHFEDMEFLLDPEAGYSKRSIVQMGEAADLVFERCIFSLRATNRVELSVVTFVDLDRIMKMETLSPPALAKVEFRECFIRGKGDLVALQGCRKLNVEMINSLVALDGSLLNIEAASKTMPMTEGVNWKMDRSSIFTTVPVFALNFKPGSTVLTETHAKIKDCLLASLGSDQDVVLPDMDKLGKYLKWECEHNYYANFDKIRDWKEKVPEVISDFGKVTFPKLTDEAKRTLWDATPDMFKPTDPEQERLIRDFGMPLESEQRLWPPPNPD